MAHRKKGKLLKVLLRILMGIIIFTILITLPFRWIAPPTSSFILQASYASEDRPREIIFEWRYWDEISKYPAIAVIAAEDQNFLNHSGFDFKEIARAINEKSKRKRGASTITQQVVKNLYLWPGKSFIRKGIEAYLTLTIELFLPKKRILEIYLNIAEFGRGVYGVEAASKTYFNKSSANLSLDEAALLAAVLPSPKRLSIVNPSNYVISRAAWIKKQIKQLGGIEYLNNL